MSDEDLEKDHDYLADRTGVGLEYYLAELNRRRQNHQTNLIICMTFVITIATLINLALFISDTFK